MAFCSNCGAQLSEGSKFCTHCGASVNEIDRSTRKVEYAGKVIKCPACGTEIPSFTAFCPGCGHEINRQGISSTISDFANQINQCDYMIANSPESPRRGWKSWGGWKKFGWVILNIYTFCIPLVIYLLLPLLGIGGTSSFTSAEQRKAQLINSFVFPNDRESILEGLLFIKAQIAALATGKFDRNTTRWASIWKNKATQLFERAEIMFKGDHISNDAYNNILSSEKKIKQSLLIRVIIAVVAVIAFAAFVFSRSGAGRQLKESTSVLEWPTSGIALHIPKPNSDKGEISINNDESFWVEVRGVDQSQYDAYLAECKQVGYIVDAQSIGDTYEAYNEDGYHIRLYHYSSSKEMHINVDAPKAMSTISWPKSAIAKRLPVPTSSYGRIEWEADYGFVIYLGNTTKQEFLEYVDKCYDAGFDVDYSRGDTYFHADDKEGYHVNIQYEGNNIMFIRIDDPD